MVSDAINQAMQTITVTTFQNPLPPNTVLFIVIAGVFLGFSIIISSISRYKKKQREKANQSIS